MKKLLPKTLCFLLILFYFASCEKDHQSKIDRSIEELNKKYPELQAGKKLPKSKFSFEKSIRNGKFNFEIQLYSQPEGYPDRNQIIVIINSKNEVYALPFFNNKYKDFWEFPFDKSIPDVPKIKTTFSKEINNAINTLILNNDRKKGIKQYLIMNELLTSVLNCKNIQEKDSAMICKTLRPNSDLPYEDSADTRIRIRKNYELMKKQWDPENSTYSNCYFDEKSARIYQVNFIENKIQIKTYRMDFGMPMLYL